MKKSDALSKKALGWLNGGVGLRVISVTFGGTGVAVTLREVGLGTSRHSSAKWGKLKSLNALIDEVVTLETFAGTIRAQWALAADVPKKKTARRRSR